MNITDKAKKIIEMCDLLEDIDDSNFEPPASESEIKEWEQTYHISIPESYKEWLLFSKNCQILGSLASFFMPDLNHYYNKFLLNEYLVIGTLGGDGEKLCFSKLNGKIVRVNHGEIIELEDFNNVLDWVIYMMDMHL